MNKAGLYIGFRSVMAMMLFITLFGMRAYAQQADSTANKVEESTAAVQQADEQAKPVEQASEQIEDKDKSMKTEVVAIKNNLLYDAAATPNLELEFRLAPKWSLELGVGFNPFPLDDTKFPKWRHFSAWIAPRYWFCNVFNRGFISANVAYALYNVAGDAYPVSWMYKQVKEGRYEGHAVLAGASFGWHFPIAPYFSIELEGGLDAGYTWYKQFECRHCGDQTDQGGHWVLLPKVGVNLSFPLGGDKESMARRCDCEKLATTAEQAAEVAEEATEEVAEEVAAEVAQEAQEQQPAEEKAAEQQPAEEKAAEQQPAEEKAAEQQPAEEKTQPAEEAQEQQPADKQAAPVAADKQQTEQQPAEEKTQPAEEKTPPAEEAQEQQPADKQAAPVAADKQAAEQTAQPATEQTAQPTEQQAVPVVTPAEQTSAAEQTAATDQAPKKQGKWNPLLCHNYEYTPFDPNVALSVDQRNVFVHFEVDDTKMDPDFFENAHVMDNVMEAIDEALNDSTIRVTRIRVVGLASFDGRTAYNNNLAKNRAATIKKYIQNGFPTLEEDLFEVINAGESWTELQYQLENSDFEAKDEVLDIIKNEKDPDARERKIKALHGGETYRQLRDGQRQILRNLGCITIFCENVE